MTPLLGTKTPSAPVGAKSGGDTRAARSLLSCALWRGIGRLWRGMGGMGCPEPLSAHRPHQQQGLSGFHETRDTAFFSNYGRSVLRGCARGGVTGNRRPGHCPRRQVTVFQFTMVHDCSLLFAIVHYCSPLFTKKYCPAPVPSCRPVAAFLCVVARHGAAMARHGRPPSPAPATRPFLFAGRQIFLLERTGLHFSPRGEVKCVRGPSGRGASRLARAGVLEQYVEHGKQVQRSPGGRIACFDRRVVRNAG